MSDDLDDTEDGDRNDPERGGSGSKRSGGVIKRAVYASAR
jgi:hypothetical protein